MSDPIPEPTGTEYYTGKPRKTEPDRHAPWWWDADDQLAPDETPESKPAFNGEAHLKVVRWFYGSIPK